MILKMLRCDRFSYSKCLYVEKYNTKVILCYAKQNLCDGANSFS